MPPGTSDIHITLGQQVSMRGAVIVTSPQMLSFIDVVKGIEMMDSLKVPTIAAVENYSYFELDGKIHKLFGDGYVDTLKKQFGIKNTVGVPILPDLSKYSDSGVPYSVVVPDGHQHLE